jgi:hypothetical protein
LEFIDFVIYLGIHSFDLEKCGNRWLFGNVSISCQLFRGVMDISKILFKLSTNKQKAQLTIDEPWDISCTISVIVYGITKVNNLSVLLVKSENKWLALIERYEGTRVEDIWLGKCIIVNIGRIKNTEGIDFSDCSFAKSWHRTLKKQTPIRHILSGGVFVNRKTDHFNHEKPSTWAG